MEFYDFPYIGNVIIPSDELIFVRGVGIPPPSDDKPIDSDADYLPTNPLFSHVGIDLWNKWKGLGDVL